MSPLPYQYVLSAVCALSYYFQPCHVPEAEPTYGRPSYPTVPGAMIEEAIPTLVLIAAAAVLAPILAEQSRGLRIPSVVLELLLGNILGPYVLKLAHPDAIVTGLSDMGLAFLMFLAGYEVDPNRVKGRPIRLATLGWLMSLALALALGFAALRK
jgi:Kef-type K+ transport system membrane component KefB